MQYSRPPMFAQAFQGPPYEPTYPLNNTLPVPAAVRSAVIVPAALRR